ncbi:arylsulfatase [Achromobacter xylosoxidans A8]|uniref:Arylsulfatase n=1 Tax=Achromobacter xylosoxidans (strain A8) TaxID=762376 RepID=E3HEM8_ACHXA|nr:arylsulfatase [Achromobacter xylosoxidans]ADP16437.1 arylsulfatase [Achromobacter xylosoxidans A8]
MKSFSAIVLAVGMACATSVPAASPPPPNVLIILADDLGYNDIQPFGQDLIQTPALQQLAQEGMRFTNFHVNPTCSPTRAQLLTGVDNHLAGMGAMGEYRIPEMDKHPGNYIGSLNDRVNTLAEVLKERGYATFMAGKWHLGGKPEQLPGARGFERSFALINPGGSHWDNKGLLAVQPRTRFVEDDKTVARDTGEFSSNLYTDRFVDYMKAAQQAGKPFFGYLAFQAVHDPLHAPEADIAKYRGKFSEGYDVHRQRLFENMQRLGVIPAGTRMSAPAPLFTPWKDLVSEERARQERVMEIYAGMVDNLDSNVGRVIDQLKRSGQYENTAIFFFSDNGPSAAYMDFYPGNADGSWIAKEFDTSFKNMGAPGSFAGVGPGWAYASSAPFKLFKLVMTEGGTISPLIVKAPMVARPGAMNDGYLGVEDIYPTVTAMTGAVRGDSRQGVPLEPLKGESFLKVLDGGAASARAPDFERGAELFGNKEYRMGKWKLSWLPEPFGTAGWQLYDTDADRGETEDLAARHPEIVKAMAAKYEAWSKANRVIQWDTQYLADQLFNYFDWRKGMPRQIVDQH